MKVGSVQANVAFGQPVANAEAAAERIGSLAAGGIDLVVFPECFLTGYCVSSREEAEAIAIPRDHESLTRLAQTSNERDVIVVAGFAERDKDHLYNSAALFEPGRPPRFYRKTHLPELGYDKFATPGDELRVFDTRLGRIGIIICFDQRAPEPARVLALDGADVILVPTNWPDGAQVSADFISIARAAENKVWMVTCDRVGTENGFTFIGRSKIISPTGQLVASAGDEEAVLVADLDLSLARQKRTVTIPGKYETEVFASRRPGLYGSVTRRL